MRCYALDNQTAQGLTMNNSFRKIAMLISMLAVAGAAVANNTTGDHSTNKSAAQSVVNEIGKGLEAIGKVVGPPVEKAEKTIRGGTKDTDNRPHERK